MSGGDEITRNMRLYLRECKRYRLTPSASGAVKVIWGPEQTIRDTYRHLTGGRTEQEDRYGMS